MKKILILPSWYPTPDDKINGSFFQEQAKILLNKYDVKVLYIKFYNRPSINLSFRSVALLTKHLLKFIIQRNEKVQFANDELFLQPPLYHYVYLTFGLTQKSFYKSIGRIYIKKIKELTDSDWKPDLIHAHSVHTAGIIALKVKQELSIPYVITEHMPFNILSYPKCIQGTIRESFYKADCVLSLSYDKVRQLGMSEINIEPKIVYNYVDESIFKSTIQRYQFETPLKIISIGAASYLKDHITLLKALKIIQSKGIPFNLTLIGLKIWGGNDTYENIIRFIESNELGDNVQIIDKVSRSEIVKYLLMNDVFLITSIAEGLPVSVLEAMATGLTVIATKHGGTEDILTPESGILVKIKDYQDIADKLIDIFYGRIKYEPKIIRDHILSICGKKAFSERISHYYDQVIYRNNPEII
jgi:glycosyltransferase involved in cell wall biosynthesis